MAKTTTSKKNQLDDKGIENFDSLNPTRQLLASMFVTLLEEEKSLNWVKGWKGQAQPENAITHRKYNGINRFILSVISRVKGYDDNRWCTFKQANEKGWKIIKNEKSTPIEFWFPYDKKENKQLSMTEYYEILKNEPERERDIFWKSYTYLVFNAKQIDGIPELPKEEKNKFNDIDIVEDFVFNLSENLGVEVIHEGDRAFYRIDEDNIHMPLKDLFFNEYEYYSTLLHEFSHSTGAESRLNRDIKNSFGTENYAKEELRAEISSCFLASELNLDISTESEHSKNHMAYVQSWIKTIKEQPKELFKAINDADGICNYLIQKGELEKCKMMNNYENLVAIEEIEDIDKIDEILGYKFVKINEENNLEFINDITYNTYEECLDNFNSLPNKYQLVNFDDIVNIISELRINKINNKEKVMIDDYNKIKPMVTINWSEHPTFSEGQILSLSEANTLFEKLDKECNENRNNDSWDGLYYYKTSFTINYTYGDKSLTYEGRQDLGDGDGSLINHIKLSVDSCIGSGFLSNEEIEEWQDFSKNIIPYLEKCISLEKSIEKVKQISNIEKTLIR